MPETVSPTELADALKRGDATLVDVRTPAEYRDVHVRGARNVPLDRLNPADFQSPDGHGDGAKLDVICQKGSRGAKVYDQVAAAGVANVANVEGGTLACVAAGLDVQRGQKTISLERQVRIAAGLLVVIGALLGAFVHSHWLGLAAFVGAGLVFAGVTDTCGMGMLLARMPWNTGGGACCSTAPNGKPTV